MLGRKWESTMMARRSIGALLVAVGCLVAPTLVGCDFVMTPTKTANGQLYQSGDGKYDPYFSAVHQQQVAAGNWPDESKDSRKPIETALDLRPGASNATILSAVRDKKGAASLASAVEQTTTAEADRARRLSATAKKLDELRARGEQLKKQAVEDRKNMSGGRADEKKVAKKQEVKREISAAVDAVEAMARDARKGAREAEELATKLRSAWGGSAPVRHAAEKKIGDDTSSNTNKPAPSAKKPVAKPATKKPQRTDAKPTEPKKPAEPAGPKEPPKREPAQQAPDEVFNP